MENEKSPEKEPVVSFRETTDEDFDFVFNLNKANMRKYVEEMRGWDDEFEREDMKKKFTPGVDRVIQIDGKDAGILKVLETDEEIKLDHVELLPEYQGQGLGSKIIGDLINKNKPIRLQVLKQNPAVELYKKLGFEIVGETDLKYQMLRK